MRVETSQGYIETTFRRLPGEEWVAFSDDYLLSSHGRWYSIRRSKILKQSINSSGYQRATIWRQGRNKNYLTHIKVVEFFGDRLGNRIPVDATSLRELGLSIDHVNRNKNDNSRANLELVTHKENCLRKFNKNNGGHKNGKRK